jgi:hypothetical protein
VREPIRKIILKDGTVRYRLVVDIGTDEYGKRKQITRTFDKLKEARAELARSAMRPAWARTLSRLKKR